MMNADTTPTWDAMTLIVNQSKFRPGALGLYK
jgi:hypothetical protein